MKIITTRVKHSFIILAKILGVALLLLFPVTAKAADPNLYNLDAWPPIIQQLENIHSNNPQDQETANSLAKAYNNYATLLAQNRKWVEAQNYLEKAVALNPTSTQMKQNLSNVYFSHGLEIYQSETNQIYNTYMFSDVKNLANKAIAANPANINAHLLLGDVEYMNQHMPEALAAWQQAAKLAPENQDIQQRMQKISREAEAETNMEQKYNAFFTIRVDQSVANIPGFNISDALNNARIAVSRDFQYQQTRKIPVIVYTSLQYQDVLREAPNWSAAAYDGKLRIILSANEKNTKQIYSNIVHEYTHSVIADLTNNNIPRWFNEGIAKYEEFRHGVIPNISLLGLAYNTNTFIPWDKIDDAFFSDNTSYVLLAYQQSYIFVYYLVERYGMSKLLNLLKTLGTGLAFDKAFTQVYGITLETVDKNWRIWLAEFIRNWAEAPATENYGR